MAVFSSLGPSAFAGNVYCFSVSLGRELVNVLDGFDCSEDPSFEATYLASPSKHFGVWGT